jgi:hypothetical protein
MNLPNGYIPGSDSMYLHIFAPTLQAALIGMDNAMRQVDWACNYIDYVMGNVDEQQVNGCRVKHCINPVQSSVGGWILEIPNVIAKRVCLPMQQWFADNPHQLQNVDLLTREQAANIKAYPELRGLKK